MTWEIISWIGVYITMVGLGSTFVCEWYKDQVGKIVGIFTSCIGLLLIVVGYLLS
jgi:hypothetical protein